MAAAAGPAPTPACGNCGAPLQVLALDGHYGSTVEIDLCAPCHLVWFDMVESARLTGPGLLALVGAMAQAQTLAHQPLRPQLPCPRCQAPVRTVHNQTRWGRSLQRECPERHGAWQSFAQFLSEKGLLRAMTVADRAHALQAGALHCVNCGGAIGPADTACSWCTAQAAVVDVARLARALDVEGATRDHAVHRTAQRTTARSCQACGAPQADGTAWNCAQCGATLTAPGLAAAHRAVLALEPALRAHAAKPAAHVVRARLAAQEPALQRQRERTAALQAEADAALGRQVDNPHSAGDVDWRDLHPAWWIAAAALLLWGLFG